MSASTLISTMSLTKRYQMGEVSIHALNNVNLTINKGEFVAIWGPSGSGKSTLCNMIGLIDCPCSGSMVLDGRDVGKLTDNQLSELRNKYIGFIFQGFNLIPVLTALENVTLPLQIRGDYHSDANKKAADLLSEVGLGDHMHHRPQKLSGGQQQRVAIARALITEPAIIIADEPTANLDSVTAQRIIGTMHDLNKQNKTTFIFSTHDQRLLEHAERKILLTDGCITEDTRRKIDIA